MDMTSSPATTAACSPNTTTIGTGAAAALSLLLREDPLLIQHGLTCDDTRSFRDGNGVFASDCHATAGNDGLAPASLQHNNQDDAALSYAAALLHGHSSSPATSGTDGSWMTSSGEYRQRATEALAEVDRKLALVESLSQRVSRESPEKVAGPLLRLHGFELAKLDQATGDGGDKNDAAAAAGGTGGSKMVTLAVTREKAERLHRQSQLLDTVAKRVESTLQRGVTRMESATTRLSRVLELSATLKMILRLQFEARKVLHAGSGLDLGSAVDLRDLTRAAASVAAMEELLPSLTPPSPGSDGREGSDRREGTIDVVENLRPEAEAVASSVRHAAAGLMNDLQRASVDSNSGYASLTRLGATLQVYFHLGELPDASWKAVSSALASTEKAGAQLFHPTALKKMREAAEAEAKKAVSAENEASAKGGDNNAKKLGAQKNDKSTHESRLDARQRKKRDEASYQRLYRRQLREKRAAAAAKWSAAVADASSKVWNLHRVLTQRNDPVSRRNFLQVVSESAVPRDFAGAEGMLLAAQRNGNDGSAAVAADLNRARFSLFSLFWVQMSIGLGGRIQRLLRYDNGTLEGDVAALYPAVRSASLSMVTELYDVMQMGLSPSDASAGDMGGSGMGGGVMGGSAGLEDTMFLREGANLFSPASADYFGRADEARGGGGGVFFGANADAWTHANSTVGGDRASGAGGDGSSSSSTLAVFSCPEWMALQGELLASSANENSSTGLLSLQTAFLREVRDRLHAPLEFLFPEAVSVDENGSAVPCLPALPSRYDLAKLDANIREEMLLADPRQGGGDLSMATMISEVVVGMLHEFCVIAGRAVSDTGEEVRAPDLRSGSFSESMAHNLNVAGVMVCFSLFSVSSLYGTSSLSFCCRSNIPELPRLLRPECP